MRTVFEKGREAFTANRLMWGIGFAFVLLSLLGLIDFGTAGGIMFFAGPTLIDPMAKKREDLKKLLKELSDAQEKMAKGEAPDQATAEALDTKATEAETLQTEIEAHDKRNKRINSLRTAGRTIADPIVPNDSQDDTDDADPWKAAAYVSRKDIVGYMRLGDYVVAHNSLKRFKEQGRPKTPFHLASIKRLIALPGEREPVIALTKAMVGATKAIPDIPDGIIEPTRLPEIVRVTENDRLQLRDILDIGRTTSDAVKYVRITSYTRGAATVARSALKPQAALAMDTITEAVRTLAVWIPVEEQQLDDLPALAGIINGELLFDLNKHIEELVMWGDGTGENFEGIIPNPAVLAMRTEVGDTLIDISRRGITDVRRAGYEPNGILVDPLDWETIVLEKGTDNRYVWVVVTDGATQRLWGVPVIETVAMEDFEGNETEERAMVVGDFRRGATLWDREDANVQTGWINDQFIRNQRTILAEMRAAFGLKRPGAFRKHQTQAPVGS